LGSPLLIAGFISSSLQHVIKAYSIELTGVTKMAVVFTCLVALEVRPTKDHLSAIDPLAIYINILTLQLGWYIYDYLQTVPHILTDDYCPFEHVAANPFTLDKRLANCELHTRDGDTE
jgi:hypothetical protein